MGCMLAEKGLLVTALVKARDEAHFNMLLGRRLNLVAAGSCCSSVEIFSGSLPPENPVGFSRRTGSTGLSRDWTSNQVVFRWPNYDMQYKSKNLITKLESDFMKLELSKDVRATHGRDLLNKLRCRVLWKAPV